MNSIQYLPDVVLRRILRNLDFYDRRSSMLVCKVWHRETFKVCDRAVLKVFTSETAILSYEHISNLSYNFNDVLQALSNSRRQYKSIVLVWATDTALADIETDTIQRICNILSSLSYPVECLKMHSCGKITSLQWLTRVLNIFPNLRHIDIDNVRVDYMPPNDIANYIEMNTPNHINTLRDKHQIGVFVRNAPDVFANLTTVFMQIRNIIPLTHLLRSINTTLVHLMLDVPPELFAGLYAVQFPMLETFDLHHKSENEFSNSTLSVFLVNAPQLKNLKLLAPGGNADVLTHLFPLYKKLKQLAINVHTLNLGVLQNVQKFTNLERLWLRGISKVDLDPSVVLPVLENVQRLILESDGGLDIRADFYCTCFPNLLVLHRQYTTVDMKWPSIVNQLPSSLRQLIIHNRFYQPDPKQLVQFCRELQVQELRLYCKQMVDRENWQFSEPNPKKQRLHLLKLAIITQRIEPGVYQRLLGSLRGLKSLQIGLDLPLDNEIWNILHQEFPWCHVTRIQKNHFVSEMGEAV